MLEEQCCECICTSTSPSTVLGSYPHPYPSNSRIRLQDKASQAAELRWEVAKTVRRNCGLFPHGHGEGWAMVMRACNNFSGRGGEPTGLAVRNGGEPQRHRCGGQRVPCSGPGPRTGSHRPLPSAAGPGVVVKEQTRGPKWASWCGLLGHGVTVTGILAPSR